MNLNLGRLLLQVPGNEYNTHTHTQYTHIHTHINKAKIIWLKEWNGFF